MNLQEVFGVMIRQAAIALSCFTLFCVTAEVIFPGFASPFIHIPLLGLISILLAWIAPLPTERISNWTRIRALFLLSIVAIGGVSFLLTQLAPLGTMAWIRLVGISLTALLIAGFLYQQTASSDSTYE